MSGGPQAEKIRTLFNTIAGDYDRLNHLLSLGIDRTWRKRALSEILPASKVLDVACGTGDFSLEIAGRCVRRAIPCAITGLDLSEGMLAVMREKVARAGYADGTFDCVTIAFGIRNFEHREQALREILRVLKPGGRLVILELSVPATPVLRAFYNLYFTHILPLIGGWISGDKAAYRYLPASVLKFPGKEEWMGIMRSCGYAEVRHKAYTLGICRQYVGVRPASLPLTESEGTRE